MHLFKQHAVKDTESVLALIPVIDFGPYFAGQPGALDILAAQLRHACENIGFLYATSHGVPQAIIDRAFAASRRFHALPLEEKCNLKLNENNIGYMPMNASVQAASTVHNATKPNQNESFFISHDRGADHPDVVAGIPLRGRNQWPDGMPDLRQDMMAYFHALSAMCDRMLPAFAVALDMPQDCFAPFFANEAHINLRFLHYPPQQDTSENTFGTAPHTDNSFMTALARTDVPGLAIRLPSGEWFAPPVIPGTFLINLGNMMRRWSNDRFLSTPHGVINESGRTVTQSPISTAPTPPRRSSVCQAASQPKTPLAIPRRCTAILCWSSTTRTTSTSRDTNPRPRTSNPVRHPHTRIIRRNPLDVPRDQQHRLHLSRRPHNRVRQLQPVLPPQCDRPLSHRLVQPDQSEPIEELPRAPLRQHRSPRHHLHPGDHADGLVLVSVQFVARRGNPAQEIDQDVGVEQRLHHSARAFS